MHVGSFSWQSFEIWRAEAPCRLTDVPSSAQSCSANIHAYLLSGSERVRLLAGEAEGGNDNLK